MQTTEWSLLWVWLLTASEPKHLAYINGTMDPEQSVVHLKRIDVAQYRKCSLNKFSDQLATTSYTEDLFWRRQIELGGRGRQGVIVCTRLIGVDVEEEPRAA